MDLEKANWILTVRFYYENEKFGKMRLQNISYYKDICLSGFNED